ncbi:hypothetical protein LIP70_12625, partial [Mediterraneibacter faecis]|uniref:hypothetical protein n=1 Tax=Mediterraneibacter faecis TaxID=592978 RepID=UPI001D0063F1
PPITAVLNFFNVLAIERLHFYSACKKIPKTTAFPFILTLILRISYTRFIFFPFAWNLILQSRIYLCKVDFTFSIHQ